MTSLHYQVHCVQFVTNIDAERTWRCTKNDCSNCEGTGCSDFTLTVSTEGAVSDLSPVSDCKYGDTVKLEKIDGGIFHLLEIAIVAKQG